MARVREARLKRGEKATPSGGQIFLQGALAKLGATLVRAAQHAGWIRGIPLLHVS